MRAGGAVEAMSKGMQQRLGIAQALVGVAAAAAARRADERARPGRAAHGARAARGAARGAASSVLLNSHLLSEVELVCDRVVILLGGEVVVGGTPAELDASARRRDRDERRERTYPEAGREDVPQLIAELVRDGQNVYGARVLTSTLEEVYVEGRRR